MDIAVYAAFLCYTETLSNFASNISVLLLQHHVGDGEDAVSVQ